MDKYETDPVTGRTIVTKDPVAMTTTPVVVEQSGWNGATIAIVAILVAVVVGLGGWYFYDRQHQHPWTAQTMVDDSKKLAGDVKEGTTNEYNKAKDAVTK